MFALTNLSCYHDQHEPYMCIVCIQADYGSLRSSCLKVTVLKMVFKELWTKNPNKTQPPLPLKKPRTLLSSVDYQS